MGGSFVESDPHTTDSHTFPSDHMVKVYTYVKNKTSGVTMQISTSEFYFDDSNTLVTKYLQVNIFGPAY